MSEASSEKGQVSLKTKLAFSSGSLGRSDDRSCRCCHHDFLQSSAGRVPALCGIAFAIGSIIRRGFRSYRRSLVEIIFVLAGAEDTLSWLSHTAINFGVHINVCPAKRSLRSSIFRLAYFTVVLIRVGKTFYSVPHAALGC